MNLVSEDCRWMFNNPCGDFLGAVRYEPLVIAVYQGPRFAIAGIQYRSTVISLYNKTRIEDNLTRLREPQLLDLLKKYVNGELPRDSGLAPYQMFRCWPRLLFGMMILNLNLSFLIELSNFELKLAFLSAGTAL
ncbi:hypothetical protein RHMOL_Rhmol12G0075500 [Rhododendron molle]|uniref:Uncharacterized protein n=1 Tax=Rhododendron molle TaxID=49168 RepID=A0ACC0LFC3_RHOML|nr:hypothetical protein RHMOL_Rhmol12G0075500 [Rhododendron molle]